MRNLYIVNYCHANCSPLQSITRLPESLAFAKANDLSSDNQGTAFGRFADFRNYYPKRIRPEKWLYDRFVAMGGKPATRHPLYFVLHGSGYLDEWFGSGIATRLPLEGIDSDHISFTLGDSMSKMDKPERKDPFRKEELFRMIEGHGGDVENLLAAIRESYTYIEAQLWNDLYLQEAPIADKMENGPTTDPYGETVGESHT
ncbi:MAG: hypothetical protein KBA30_00440 [Clostridia bacterium]|nr:hypothetical protein [Clostridia bacterium]